MAASRGAPGREGVRPQEQRGGLQRRGYPIGDAAHVPRAALDLEAHTVRDYTVAPGSDPGIFSNASIMAKMLLAGTTMAMA
jgi:hypothetical protein